MPQQINQPAQEPKAPKELRIRLPSFSRGLLLGIVAVVVVVAAAGFFITRHSQQHDPLPAKVKQEAGFTLYYPKYVPAGFRFDEAAYDSEVRVVTYDYSTVDGSKLYFSLQAKPPHFNFNDFNNKQLTGSHQISTPVGPATIGILQKQTVSSVVAGNTWVLIGAGAKTDLSQLEQISQSLAPAKK